MWSWIFTSSLTLGALFHLWRRPVVQLWSRLLWSLFCCAPAIGPILYLAMFETPSPNSAATGPREDDPVGGEAGRSSGHILDP